MESLKKLRPPPEAAASAQRSGTEQGAGPKGIEALTVTAVVVHQDDLLEQAWRRALDGGVDGAQQHRECFVDEDKHNAHLRQAIGEGEVAAPREKNGRDLRPAGDSGGVTPAAGPPHVLAPALPEGSGFRILPRASYLVLKTSPECATDRLTP